VKKNIIDFRRDGDFYFERAERFLDKGDGLSALENMRRAVKHSPSEDFFTFRIARIYSEMGLFGYANDIYFKLISQEKCLLESYFGLTQNYMEDDDLETAYHYLKCSYECQKGSADPVAEAESLGLDVDSLYDIIEELEDRSAEFEARRGFRLVYDRDDNQKKLLNSAHNLMALQEFQKALEAYSVIPADCKYYCEALGGITLCRYLLKDYAAAKTAADEAERLFPDDVMTLCNRLMLAVKTKDKAGIEKYTQAILSRKDMDEDERYRAAMVFCEIDSHGLAADALEHILKECPYDPQILLLCAQAHYNNDNGERAADLCRKILKISEDNSIARYYLAMFAEPKKGKLHYACQVPAKEIASRIKLLTAAVKSPPAEFSRLIDYDGELFSIIKWTETLDDIPLSLLLYGACVMSGNLKAREYLSGLLISTGICSFLKKQLLVMLLNGAKDRQPVKLIVDGVFMSARFNAPRQLDNFPPAYRESYVNVFATLALVEKNFEAKLNTAARELLKLAEPYKDALKDKKALSAVLNLIYGGEPAFKSKAVLCEIYNTNMTTLRAYIKKLGIRA